jgi:hypothetical protein
MTTIRAFIKGHPLLSYVAVTFIISWGTILLVVGPGEVPLTPGTLPMAIFLAASLFTWQPTGCSWCWSTTALSEPFKTHHVK